MWTSGYAVIKKVKNDKNGFENRAVCCSSNCKWSLLAKSSSGLTGSIARHLREKHEILPPNSENKTRKPIDHDRADNLLLKFIITGFLSFLIVENEAFAKYNNIFMFKMFF